MKNKETQSNIKSGLTPILMAELRHQLIDNINDNIKKPLCKHLLVDERDGKIIINIFFEDGSSSISTNTRSWLSSATEKFLRKKGVKKVKIEVHGPLTELDPSKAKILLEDISDKILTIFTENLGRLLNVPQLSNIVQSKSNEGKTSFLRSLFLTFVEENLQKIFPFLDYKKIKPVFLALIECEKHLTREADGINSAIRKNNDDFIKKINQNIKRVEFEYTGNSSEYYDIDFIKFIQDILTQPLPVERKWNKLSCLYSHIEDFIEGHQKLIDENAQLKKMLNALKKFPEIINSAFLNIDVEDQIKLVGQGIFYQLKLDLIEFIKNGEVELLIDQSEKGLKGKKLTRDSLGKNGIKIYDLDCLIVKSDEYPAEHLWFVAHSIPGTNNYVYIPEEIISHEKYERFLHNHRELAIAADKARQSVSLTLIANTSEAKNESCDHHDSDAQNYSSQNSF